MQTEYGEVMTDGELAELELGSAVSAGAVREIKRLRKFAESFLNPEDNGYAVSAWIRDEAREALGLKRIECLKKPGG